MCERKCRPAPKGFSPELDYSGAHAPGEQERCATRNGVGNMDVKVLIVGA